MMMPHDISSAVLNFAAMAMRSNIATENLNEVCTSEIKQKKMFRSP